MLDSGKGKINIDSLVILSSNIETEENVAFAYSLNNLTSDTISTIALQFWLSKDTKQDSLDNLLLELRFDQYPPQATIRKEITASLPSIEEGDYYLIGKALVEEEPLNETFTGISIKE